MDLDEKDLAGINWLECPGIESKPTIQGGAPVFKGTRMPVSTVTENLDQSIETMLELYPSLTRKQVDTVIGFLRKRQPLATARP
jgi:uncharacterized protein (DUF433 family)